MFYAQLPNLAALVNFVLWSKFESKMPPKVALKTINKRQSVSVVELERNYGMVYVHVGIVAQDDAHGDIYATQLPATVILMASVEIKEIKARRPTWSQKHMQAGVTVFHVRTSEFEWAEL